MKKGLGKVEKKRLAKRAYQNQEMNILNKERK